MNSTVRSLDIQPVEYWQSKADSAAAFAAVGARSSRRMQRSWQQRAATVAGVVVLQILVVTALIVGGHVSVPRLPESITIINIPAQDLTLKEPPPKMPEMVIPIVPIATPITIDVQSETAITLPPPKAEAAAPATPTGGGTSAALAYQTILLRQIDAAKRYPPIARAQQRQGVVLVQFTMDRTGHVLGAALAKSSKADVLDREGVEAVKRASPFPAPPPEIAGDPVNLMVAVEFSLH